MIDILSSQAALIASLQQEAKLLREREPPADIRGLLGQINDAVAPLKGLDTYHAIASAAAKQIAQIQTERDSAVGHLCKLIDILLDTNTIATMTYSQSQIDAAFTKAQAVLLFFKNHSDELASLQTKLDAALSDDVMDKTKIQELQAQLTDTQDNLGKFVAEFTEQSTPTPPEPSTGTDTTTTA